MHYIALIKSSPGFLIAQSLLILIGVASFYSTQKLFEASTQKENSLRSVEMLESLFSDVKDAESSSRGFALTGNEEYLEPYYETLVTVPEAFVELRNLFRSKPNWSSTLDELEDLVKRRLAISRNVITLRRSGGLEAAQTAVATGVGKETMSELRNHIKQLMALEQEQLGEHDQTAQRTALLSSSVIVFGSLVALLLVLYAGWKLAIDMEKRKYAEKALATANHFLESGMVQLEQRNNDISLLASLAGHLQVCQNLEEARDLIAHFCQRLFPGDHGAMYLFTSSRDSIERVANWGQSDEKSQMLNFHPDQCWALRRGMVHSVTNVIESGAVCSHINQDTTSSYTCVPMVAQGEAIGLFYLGIAEMDGTRPRTERDELAITVAEQLGLAISNLQLRDQLRLQSIRDVLTGLFNRRYMEESLERELKRAERVALPLSVLILDIDHFKQFNDTYGHEAGDLILQQVGEMLSTKVRGDDIPCRLGGEEFIIILPGATTEVAAQRAEELRQGMKGIRIRHHGQTIVNVRCSVGVSTYPQHGAHKTALVEAADRALYRAKEAGRNQVMTA